MAWIGNAICWTNSLAGSPTTFTAQPVTFYQRDLLAKACSNRRSRATGGAATQDYKIKLVG
jgi:hypothetical protein